MNEFIREVTRLEINNTSPVEITESAAEFLPYFCTKTCK